MIKTFGIHDTNHDINYNKQYLYMDGVIFKQIYSPRHSTETRLICKMEDNGLFKMKLYDAEQSAQDDIVDSGQDDTPPLNTFGNRERKITSKFDGIKV